MYKIALDIRKIGKKETGSEIYFVNLIKNLSKIDKNNTYFLCTDSSHSEAIARRVLKKIGKNFKFRTLKPSSKLFWTQKALPQFCKKNKIDLVHVEYISPLRLPSKTKLITTIHDVSFKRHGEFIKRLDRMILNFFIPKSLKKADKIISVSRFTKKEILDIYKFIPSSKVKVIYNGIDEKNFKPKNRFDKEKIISLKNKFSLKKKFILNVSSLQPRKNLPALIKAFRDFITKYGDEETILAIGGRKAHNYDYRIDYFFRDPTLKKRVKFLGYIKDEELPILYSMASLYVSPSIYEGFNLPLVEVMKSAVPIIASNLSCHKEILEDAGVLIDPFDSEKFSEKIHQMLSDDKLRKKLVKKGLERVEKFNWQKCAKNTLKTYLEFLN
ncbi:MAG: glycosyltransferase [Candidatus Moranbacteria bacterium]|nr:glycosyltransferase [Candidatus Moranbacteria bacterium]